MIIRQLTKKCLSALESNKVTIIYGSRQVGKTTLAMTLLSNYESPLILNCDDPSVASSLANKSAIELKSLIGDSDIVFIDEAQRVENIGITLKIIHDTYPDTRLLVTGSSSLDLANKITEPLTGRSVEILLAPLSLREVSSNHLEKVQNQSKMLIRGGYPESWSMTNEDARKYLTAMANQYIHKDIFGSTVDYDESTLIDIMRLLAYQIGSEVSYNELANTLGIDKGTAKRYVGLLERSFIIFRLHQFRRNMRVTVGKKRKIYFWDLGIRNGLINNFEPLDFRSDKGALWENFCIVERRKNNMADDLYINDYYWRKDKAEIDYVEVRDSKINAYEYKYSDKKTAKLPSAFAASYPEVPLRTINSTNAVFEFI
jgi:uncharacterized protein